ncbi:MAG: 23S rRNA (adenine(2030)-N(6))-methyltransferase RlmJ [Hyphomonadaceae bacterium]|jgi:23S rRNA (adenine2030-N6)-methyltransferase|nr:23S rRNA (adenine(2030)-N(6))-methyltransferase RlmJ [Hyphomonadaceae bacterium]
MNYRHAYHAGNFADVLKHLTLALVIDHLKRKEGPFRVVDTHAGCGRYELDSVQAAKTGEWRGGIGRLLGSGVSPLPPDVAQAMAPYLDAVRAVNPAQQLAVYPGSPLIALHLMRSQDVLVANELHPEDRAQLSLTLGRDRRIRLLAIDGWIALKSLLPPKERRGVILIDPPFEQPDELAWLSAGLAEALGRFETGVYLAWYPIKDLKPIATFHRTLAGLERHDLLRVELMIRDGQNAPDRLNGCGLIVANPPYTLRERLAAVLPELTQRLAEGAGAHYRLDDLVQTPHVAPFGRAGSHRRKVAKR